MELRSERILLNQYLSIGTVQEIKEVISELRVVLDFLLVNDDVSERYKLFCKNLEMEKIKKNLESVSLGG